MKQTDLHTSSKKEKNYKRDKNVFKNAKPFLLTRNKELQNFFLKFANSDRLTFTRLKEKIAEKYP